MLQVVLMIMLAAGSANALNLISNGDFFDPTILSHGSTGDDIWIAYYSNVGEGQANPATWVGTSGTTEETLVIQGGLSEGSGVEQTFDLADPNTVTDYILSFKFGYTNIGGPSGVVILWRDAAGSPVGSTYFSWGFKWDTDPDPNPNDVVWSNSSWSDGHIVIGKSFRLTRGDSPDGPSLIIPHEARKGVIRLLQYSGYRTYFDDVSLVPVEPTMASHTVDFSAGQPFNNAVRGQNVKTSGSADIEEWYNGRVLDISRGSSLRGVAGGLNADSYNWKNRTGIDVASSGTPGRTTLEFLREARDYKCLPLITVNVRSIGFGMGANWVPTNSSVSTLASLAADWVYYTNVVVQNYRQGDALPSRAASLISSLDWDSATGGVYDPSYDTLPAAGEASPPKVRYWEIGNEPAVPYLNLSAISVAQYVINYKAIAAAMKAEDPTIQVGPCFTNTISEEAYYDALLADPAAPVDFISFHPYNNIEYFNETIASLENKLTNSLKVGWIYNKDLHRAKLLQHGRSADTPLFISEWNPGKLTTTLGKDGGSTMVHALACAELVFTGGEMQQLLGAQHWIWPVGWQSAVQIPVQKVFDRMQDYMGKTLVDSYIGTPNFRLYSMRNAPNDNLVTFWALNFSDTDDVEMKIDLANLDLSYPIEKVMKYELSNHVKTGLLTLNDFSNPNEAGWQVSDITGMGTDNLVVTFKSATVTVIAFNGTLPRSCDDPTATILIQDLNKDCYVDFQDLVEMLKDWLKCSDPANASCDEYWLN